LGLFAREKLQHVETLGFPRTQLGHEALDGIVGGPEAVLAHEVLIDRHRVAAERELLLDPCAMRLAGGEPHASRAREDARRRRLGGLEARWPGWGNFLREGAGAGGHPGGI
jgi:hypothetical protein